jgi:hypothetical protein
LSIGESSISIEKVDLKTPYCEGPTQTNSMLMDDNVSPKLPLQCSIVLYILTKYITLGWSDLHFPVG